MRVRVMTTYLVLLLAAFLIKDVNCKKKVAVKVKQPKRKAVQQEEVGFSLLQGDEEDLQWEKIRFFGLNGEKESPLSKLSKKEVHWLIKVGFWFVTGVCIGIYFEAKYALKSLMMPIVNVTLYAFLISVAVYSLFVISSVLELFV